MSTPSISVIIPAYNAERFLGEALASVGDQTLAAGEVIVVDDGSSDGTAEVARSWGGAVRLLQQENQGPAAARNLAIGQAQGEFLAFLDADDLMTPDRLQLQWQILREQPALDLVFGQQKFFSHATGDPSATAGRLSPGMILSALFSRASVFTRFGLFDREIHGSEFVIWCAEAMRRGATHAILPQLVVHRRVHDNNLSSKLAKNTDHYTRQIKLLLDRRRRSAA